MSRSSAIADIRRCKTGAGTPLTHWQPHWRRPSKRKAGSGLGGLGGFFSPPLLCTNTADRACDLPSAALLAAEAHSATSLDPPNPPDPLPFVSDGLRQAWPLQDPEGSVRPGAFLRPVPSQDLGAQPGLEPGGLL